MDCGAWAAGAREAVEAMSLPLRPPHSKCPQHGKRYVGGWTSPDHPAGEWWMACYAPNCSEAWKEQR